MAKSPKCAKCGAAMETGIVIDQTYGYSTVSVWLKGKPERGFWTGLKLRTQPKPTETFRCTSCGYLESYAK